MIFNGFFLKESWRDYQTSRPGLPGFLPIFFHLPEQGLRIFETAVRPQKFQKFHFQAPAIKRSPPAGNVNLDG
jgi:hypothetical protein